MCHYYYNIWMKLKNMKTGSLTKGQISVAKSKVYAKLGNGTVRDLTLDTDTKVQVINNLTSSSTTSALSANQGRLLNNAISGIKSIKLLQTLSSGSALSFSSSYVLFLFVAKCSGSSGSDVRYIKLRWKRGTQFEEIKLGSTLSHQTMSGYCFIANTSEYCIISGPQVDQWGSASATGYFISDDLVNCDIEFYGGLSTNVGYLYGIA